MRTYLELSKLKTFKERFDYLKLDGTVGKETFGFDRYLNQRFYRSAEWRQLRNEIIVRDNGCDLGIDDFTIGGKIYIHHMNPIQPNSLVFKDDDILNPDYLICVSHKTHNAIHYGSFEMTCDYIFEGRKAEDTKLW